MDSDFRTRRGLRGFSVNRLIPNILTIAALCSGLTAIRFALFEADGHRSAVIIIPDRESAEGARAA